MSFHASEWTCATRAFLRSLGITSGHIGAVDKPYPIFELRDKIEEKTGWEGYADTDRR